MEFIKSNWKSILKYIVIYILIVFFYQTIFYYLTMWDGYNSYAFSHAIKNGELIYRDFNTITTPMYAFVMSLGLHIYDNYIVMILEQSLLVTIMLYILNKNLSNKFYLFIAIILVFFSYTFFMTYNFFTLFMIVILYYLEKKYPNRDYLIGFVIGLSILSKHTIGCLLVVPMIIISIKDKKRLLKRFIGLLIPCFIFLIYLLLNNNLYNFINLCFLGLSDFSNKNSNLQGSLFYLSIILLIINLIFVYRHRNLKYNYYIPFTFSFVYPLFDYNHFCYYCFFICLMAFDFYGEFKYKSTYYASLGLLLLLIVFLSIIRPLTNFKYCSNIKRFDNFLVPREVCQYWSSINKFLDKYKDKNTILFSSYSPIYDVSIDKKISYYEVLYYGNLGYNGTNNIINDIKRRKNIYYIIDKSIYINSQYNNYIVEYIMKHYKRVESEDSFIVYYKE